MANVILTNGARFYVDHAHPEYSSPEVPHPARRGAVGPGGGADPAGVAAPGRGHARLTPVTIYKNNTDGKGASYGTHENYLMNRATPFGDVVRHLTPFFVSRQVFTGAGRRAGPGLPEAGSRSASAPTSSRSRSAWRRR